MKLTEGLCGGDRNASSNAVHVQDRGLCPKGVAWLLIGLGDDAGGGLGMFRWRGRGCLR